MSHQELTLVMPVYNEEAVIDTVIHSWAHELDRLQIRHSLLVYDDGSRDATAERLRTLERTVPNLRVVRQANRGHGPTVLRGYREACGDWVLQIDGDGEVGPAEFESLWAGRESCDVIVGFRVDRRSPRSRRIVTRLARLTVRLLFGRTVTDVNCPYRLMRGDRLRSLLAHVPADTFAPNVAIAGLALASGMRVRELPVSQRGASSGFARGARLWLAATRSAVQTLVIAARFRARRLGRAP